MGEVVKLPVSETIEVEFETRFWPSYPRREDKGHARPAFKRARNKATLDLILAGVSRYADKVKGREKRFVCLPATWLNGERWLDEPEVASQATATVARLAHGLSPANWAWAVQWWRKSSVWHAPGGCPGSLSYQGPLELLTVAERMVLRR